MDNPRTHKDLEVWKASMDLVTEIYKATMAFPSYELYALTSQLRRAAVSVPSNIAEGAARRSTKEFLQFLYMSMGSLSEIETQLEIAFRLKYSKSISALIDKMNDIRRMITSLINALKRKLE